MDSQEETSTGYRIFATLVRLVLGGVLGGVIAVPLIVFVVTLNAWALMMVWGYLIVPSFEIDPLTFRQALGAGVIVTLLMHAPDISNKVAQDKATKLQSYSIAAVTAVHPLIVVGVAGLLNILFF